jgi:hypothetical protein
MRSVPSSSFIAIVALGIACFSTGFSLTTSAYARLGSPEHDEVAPTSEPRKQSGERHCASR